MRVDAHCTFMGKEGPVLRVQVGTKEALGEALYYLSWCLKDRQNF